MSEPPPDEELDRIATAVQEYSDARATHDATNEPGVTDTARRVSLARLEMERACGGEQHYATLRLIAEVRRLRALVDCRGCLAGYRLKDTIHYDDARNGGTWGVCNRYVLREQAKRAREAWLPERGSGT